MLYKCDLRRISNGDRLTSLDCLYCGKTVVMMVVVEEWTVVIPLHTTRENDKKCKRFFTTKYNEAYVSESVNFDRADIYDDTIGFVYNHSKRCFTSLVELFACLLIFVKPKITRQ